MKTNVLAIGFLVVLCLLSGCSIFGGSITDDMDGLFDVDPENACSIVLAETDAEAGIAAIGTKIVIEGVAYVRRGKCSQTELEMFKVANRLQG